MSAGNMPRDDVELAAFLARQSPISMDYGALELVEPPSTLNDKILAAAKVAAKPATKPPLKPVVMPGAGKPVPAQPARAAASAGASSAIPSDPAERRTRPRAPAPTTGDDDDAAPARRPRWLVPAALAASVLVAIGVGVTMLGTGTSGTEQESGAVSRLGSLFAKRARERSEEEKAAAAASAEQDAEVVELELAPLPPPPVFEAEGPQVQDLDAAIALIRKELLLVNQAADAVAPAAPDAPSVVQPRERRLTKILELHDRGDPDLAGDSLEIFLRDFEDDPISQRILGAKP